MAERMKLKIMEVMARQEVGDNKIPKLSFKALNENGAEHTYFTFKTSLFETIEKKGELDAEVETETKGDYINHKITQLYVDGQPVQVKKDWSGKSQLTPEQWAEKDRIERRSIERQVSAKIAAEIIEKPASLEKWAGAADYIFDWISEGKPTDKPQDAKPAEKKAKPVPKAEDIFPDEKRNPESLVKIPDLQKALKEDFGMTDQQMKDELKIKYWSDLSITPAEAYKKIASSRPDK